MSGPNSKPEAGQQNFRTPPEFLVAAAARAGAPFDFDCACTFADAVAASGFPYPQVDALAQDWRTLQGQHCWLNPPFKQAAAFAAKCAESGADITALLPASVGTAWYAKFAHGRGQVIFLRPRIVFLQPNGTPMPAGINRDCMLVLYGRGSGYSCEDWREWKGQP